MGRTREQFTKEVSVDGKEAKLTVVYHWRGSNQEGHTDLIINNNFDKPITITLGSKEDALTLAEFINSQINYQPKPKGAPNPTYNPTGWAVMVVCDGKVIKTVYDHEMLANNSDSFTYESFAKAFAGKNGNDYYYVLYALKDGSIGRDKVEAVIKACIDYQKELLITGNLHVAKPMTQVSLSKLANVRNDRISRIVKGARVFTSHGNYSLEKVNGHSEFLCLFNEGIGNGADDRESSLKIKKHILELIEKEDKAHPLTDDEIMSQLVSRGFSIERRTVVKYRAALNLPNSRKRRLS